MKDVGRKVDAQSPGVPIHGPGAVELAAVDQEKLVGVEDKMAAIDAVFQRAFCDPENLKLAVPVERHIVGRGMPVVLGIDGNRENPGQKPNLFLLFFIGGYHKFHVGLIAFRKRLFHSATPPLTLFYMNSAQIKDRNKNSG